MTGVDNGVGFTAEDLAERFSDTARVTTGSNFRKDDNIDTGVRHSVVDKVVVGVVVDGSIHKFIFHHKVSEQEVTFVVVPGSCGGICVSPDKD